MNDALMWIPVTDRLPEPGEYLCTIKSEYGYHIELAYYNVEYENVAEYDFVKKNGYIGWYTVDDERGCVEENVIAWMPLPEPYKEGITDE